MEKLFMIDEDSVDQPAPDQDGLGTEPKAAMTMNRKTIIGIVVVAVAIVAVAGLVAIRQAGPGAEPIVIGAILPLTGAGAASGSNVHNGLRLAAREINAADPERPIQLLVADNKTDPDEAVRLFQAMEAESNPLAYFTMQSGTAIKLAPLAEENEVPLLAVAVSAPEFTSEYPNWTFRYWPTATDVVDPVLLILEELGIQQLGVLYLDDAFGRANTDALEEAFAQTGGSIVRQPVKRGDSDYQNDVTALKNTEAIYVITFPSQTKLVFETLAEAGYAGHIIGAHSAALPSIFSSPEADGSYVAAPALYNPGSVFSREVSEKYEDAFDKPVDYYATSAYDVVKLIVDVVERSGVSRSALRDELDAGFTYSGASGVVTVQEGSHDIGFPLYAAKVVNGELEYLR